MKNAAARPVQSARIALDDIAFEGNGLVRPECVLATRAGDLYTSDWRGGVAQLRADGVPLAGRGWNYRVMRLARCSCGSRRPGLHQRSAAQP